MFKLILKNRQIVLNTIAPPFLQLTHVWIFPEAQGVYLGGFNEGIPK